MASVRSSPTWVNPTVATIANTANGRSWPTVRTTAPGDPANTARIIDSSTVIDSITTPELHRHLER